MSAPTDRFRLWHLFLLVAVCAGALALVVNPSTTPDPLYAAVARLRSSDPETRLEALRQLDRLRPAAGLALSSLLEALTDVDPRVRARAARLIGSLRGPDRRDHIADEATRPIRVLLNDPDASVRHAAAIALAALDPADSKLVPALIEALIDDDPAVRIEALEAIGSVATPGDETAFRAIFDRLEEPNPAVRAAVFRALGRSELVDSFQTRIAPAAISALNDGSSEVRTAAKGLVKRLASEPDGGIAGLSAAMTDPDSEVRSIAIEESVGFKPRRVFQLLLRATTDPDPKVRERACWRLGALDNFDGEATLAALRIALNDKDPAVQASASGAIRAIEGHAETRALALEQDLFELFDFVDDDPTLRSNAAFRLGAYAPSTPEVIASLIKALTDPEPTVAAASAHALGEIGPAAKGAIPALDRLAKHENEVVVRAAGEAAETIRASLKP